MFNMLTGVIRIRCRCGVV